MKFDKKRLFCASLFFLLFSAFVVSSRAEDKAITIDVENMEISSVLKMISDQSGLNLAVSNDVTGNITVKLDHVTVYQALDSVLKTNNYLYSVDGDIINVYSYQDVQQQERFAALQTRVFTLLYTDVIDLKRILLSMKTPRGKIETNEKTNQVVVTDTPEKVKEVERALAELDQKTEIKKYKLLYSKAKDVEANLLKVIPAEKGDVYTDERTNTITVRATSAVLENIDDFIESWDSQHKQVLIEAMILEVTLDESTKLGVEWEQKSDNTAENHPSHPAYVDLAAKFAANLATGGIFKVGSLTADEYSITVEALTSNANTEVLSSPRVVVIDGEAANILVGSNEPYSVSTTDPVTKLLVEDIRYVDVGIKLEVTPQIGEDDYVTMKIHPEVSTARRVTEVNNVVAKDTTEADTTMMIKNGETIILGGLIKNTKKKTVNKVPLLGDIPILGLLFKSRDYEDVKKEIIVFITPHVLTNDNRQTVSRQKYKASIDRTGKGDELIEKAIEESGGVEITPPRNPKKSEAIRKEIMRLLDLQED